MTRSRVVMEIDGEKEKPSKAKAQSLLLDAAIVLREQRRLLNEKRQDWDWFVSPDACYQHAILARCEKALKTAAALYVWSLSEQTK